MSETTDVAPEVPPVPEGLEATASWVGNQVWIARRLFEIVGGWSADEVDPEARVWFATVSRRHGWHSGLLYDLLPDTAEHQPDELVAEPGGGWGVALDELSPPASTGERLAGFVRVVFAHLVTTHQAMADRTTAVAGGPLRRALELVIRDERDDRRDGEALLERILTRGGPDAVRAATDQQLALETALLLPLEPAPD